MPGRIWANNSQLKWTIESLVEREPIYPVNPKVMIFLTRQEVRICEWLPKDFPTAKSHRALA